MHSKIFSNGQEWWKLRSEFQKGLSSPQNVRNLLPQTDDMVREFISILPSRFDDNCTIRNFVDEIERFSLELTCLIAFDERMNSSAEEERDPNSRTSRIIKASDDSNDAVLPTDQGLQLWRFFETSAYKQLRLGQEYKEKFVIEFIQKKAYQKDRGNSLLDQYFSNPNINVKDIVGMSADLLLGGIHTTSFSTSFALYHLSRNERVQNLLYEEAMRVLPTFDDKVTPQVMNSEIPYTRAVLKETFRLNPISIGVGRILNHDTILGGYLVPKDVSLLNCYS
jgi:ecdysteroid 25-hydroxylase CYP302A1